MNPFVEIALRAFNVEHVTDAWRRFDQLTAAQQSHVVVHAEQLELEAMKHFYGID